MIRPKHASARCLFTVAALILAGCSDQSVSGPALDRGSSPRADLGTAGALKDPKDPTLPFAVPYSGVLRPGQFVVCTNKIWPTATYAISVNAVDPKERYVTTVTVAGGECAVVFDGNKKKKHGVGASISVTSDPLFYSDGAVVIDGTGARDYPGVSSQQQTFLLTGFAGAVAKFYHLAANPCDPYQCHPGGHGGTGTATFTLD